MNNKKFKCLTIFISFLLCFFFISVNLAVDSVSVALIESNLTLQSLIAKIQGNQSKIEDMYAETTTTITSSIVLPGAEDKGPQKMVQKGKIWTKGKDKSKIEMISPMKQITITNGDQMAIIYPDTGQKIIQDLSKQGMPQSSNQMDLEKAMDYFDLSVKSQTSGEGEIEAYIITGIPKEENKFFGKMEFYINPLYWVPEKILMYDPTNRLISLSEIEYKEISDVWIPAKNISTVNTPVGKMLVEMEFENIKVNQGIGDEVFKI